MEIKLNPQQEEAASHVDGPCLVVSVPGSGKTALLTERTARLIESGVPANRVVCLTFTNKAANEMKERICKRLDISSPKCYVGTFHALCVLILRKHGYRIGYTEGFSIIDSDDQIDFVKQCARILDKTVEKTEAYKILSALNNWRENLWDREQFEEVLHNESDLIQIGDLYLERLKKANSIDFSGLLYETIQLIDQEEEIRERIQDRFQYLSIDEAQDTNYAQFYLINKFSEKHKNVFLVGDISQGIYGWRGARYQNIKDFLDMNSNCKTVELPLNYRSTPQVVKLADTLIRHNASHMAKEFIATKPSGEEIKYAKMYNEVEEGEYVARQIKRLIEEGGWDPGDVAVLYRMNSMTEPIERALANDGIKYKVIGGKSFYSRKEIKDCISMLKLVSNPKDGVAFHRIATLVEGMGDVTVGKIEVLAEAEKIDLLEATERMIDLANREDIKEACRKLIDTYAFDKKELGPDSCLTKIIDRFKYSEHLENKYESNWQERLENVDSFINQASLFVEKKGPSVDNYLQSIALISSFDEETKDETVSLMTLHAAKGLEFPIVFMIGIDQDILPHIMSIRDNPFEGVEEERRLCYVGMTRAEKLLYLTHCSRRRKKGYGGFYDQKYAPSRFLYEAGILKNKEKR